MKKQILNLGKALNKAEQKVINGGRYVLCSMELGGCPCNCFWDDIGQCVTDISVFTRPCE